MAALNTFKLQVGSKGQEVKLLQTLLKIGVDGDFGAKTAVAVRDFQAKNKIQATGIADFETLLKLGMPVWAGIDVSNCNGDIDWDAVAKAGIKFAWVKCTEGSTFIDKKHAFNLAEARKRNIVVGGYHYGRPDTDTGLGMDDAEAEAEAFVKALGPIQKGDLRPALDLEAGLKSDDKYNVKWMLTFLKHVEELTGVRPIVYTAEWAVDLYMHDADPADKAELATYAVWWASYGGSSEPYQPVKIWTEWAGWQWTGSGHVPGVDGKVDRDWISGAWFEKLRA